ncbi:MAG: RNA polymerase sigma factor [Deltaproteobacteria bacterium]|nr:RNA polymerase sigma factor [Deltaproteobacteria bacterium]
MPKLVYSQRQQLQSWKEASDRDLLEGLRQGDEIALDQLIERKTKPLIQAAYRILGDYEESRDVVQMTFVRVWEKRDQFDPKWSPNTWIFRITTNLAIDQLRSRKTRERIQEPVRNHLRQVADRRSEREFSKLQRQEVSDIFHELAKDLSERQRTVFLLREVEGLSSQEVAQIVGCRESTVRNHLFNARKVLRREVRLRFPEYSQKSPDTETAVGETR